MRVLRLLLFTVTLLLIFYLNFRYGFSYRAGDPSITNEMREVRERDYFFIASFAFAGVLIAAAFAAAIRGIGDWLGPPESLADAVIDAELARRRPPGPDEEGGG